jgi:nicotinamidase-related amidase
MPANTTLIDRDDLVLVVIDIQERLAAVMERREQVLAASSKVIRTSALVGAPIVVTRQYPQGLGGTEPEVISVLEGVATDGATVVDVDKTTFCSCGEPAFLEALAATGRRQVALVGMETHICVTQTALDLVGRGYRVQVVADACCSRAAENHDNALDRLRAAGVVVTNSESLMYEAVGVAGTPEFKALLGIVKG